MDPIRFAIQNPVKVSVGVILLLMFGALALTAIPIQLTPNVDRAVVSIQTRWEGASPLEVESEILREQEDKLKSIPGLEKMTATAEFGQGNITLEFPVGADKDASLREVSEKLRQVPDYPDQVDEPIVEASDPRDRDYIAWISLTTDDPDYDIRHIQKWAEDHVKTALDRVQGVSESNVLGGSEPEVQVQTDPVRMAQLGISPGQLIGAIQARNLNVSAGDRQEGKLNPRLRVTGEYERLQQIADTVVSAPGDPIIRVRDVVAENDRGEPAIVLTYKEPFAIVRSKGERALAINVQREVGSNVMRVMEGVREAIAHLNANVLPNKAEELGLDGGLELVQLYDQTIYIQDAINLVRNNIFYGGTIAVIVLLLFLRSVRATAVVGLAIPISIVGTFVAMVAMGRNINVISLAGLAFAVGMVVDNAIVVLENIDRQIRLGKTAPQAAYDGGKEVWGAILASTLTTLAVFIPVIFIEEEAGQLFRDISLAICSAVTLSLITSVLVIPSASARFLKAQKRDAVDEDVPPTTPSPQYEDRHLGQRAIGAAGAVVRGFGNTIHWLTGTWVVRPAIVIVLTVAALGLSWWLMPAASYLPAGNRNLVFALQIPPPGYNLEKMETVGLRIEDRIAPYWQAQPGTEAAEQLPPIAMFNPETRQVRMVEGVPISNFFFVGLRNGLMFGGAISADRDVVQPVAGLLNNAIQDQPGIIGFASQPPLIGSGEASNSVEIEITGDDFDQITGAAGALFGRLMAEQWSARPDPGNFATPTEEIQVKTDPVRSSEVGMTTRDAGNVVAMLGDGRFVGDYTYRGDNIDMKVLAGPIEALADDPMAIRDMPVHTPVGVVPLEDFADVFRTVAPQQIKRIERQRAVVLTVQLPEDMALDAATQMIRQEMIAPLRQAGAIPPTVQVEVAGTAAKLAQVKEALLGESTGLNVQSLVSLFTSRAFLSLLVVFLLMAALFESWFYPAVIMFTVPLATIGGFLGLRIVHEWTDAMPFIDAQQLDVLTMLGFVILIGIVVNNAILIVHQALNFMRGQADVEGAEGAKKLDPRQAIAASVRTRVRPIFMSTFTSVGGMLPLVVIPGPGSELYRGLGSVVVGGLLVSGVFTLVLTPLVMSLVFDLRRAIGSTRV